MMSECEWGDRLESPLTDDDPMPFGKHKDKPMREVPPDYLMYIFEADWISEWPAVYSYIANNVESIEDEAEEAEDDFNIDYEDHTYREIE